MENEKDDLPVITIQGIMENLTSLTANDLKAKLKSHTYDFDSVNDKGKTLLIILTETFQDSDRLWVVLEYFADPNIKDSENDKTALHYACKQGNKGMILALLMFGAHTDILDKEEKKPFQLCPNLNDELENTLEHFINKYKTKFLQLTRKRRKMLKKIFESMDQETKLVDEFKLAT
jgi:ankyrin repeat protein